MTAQNDWWSTFFSGRVLDAVRAYGAEETRAEADFIVRTLGLSAGASLLDVPCGAGRLSLELAARRYDVTGVDIARELIEDCRRSASEQGLPAVFENREMRDLPWKESFDGAFCFGNSFGYLDDDGNEQFLKAVHRILKPGGKFLLDTPTVAEAFFLNQLPNSWHEDGDTLLLRNATYDHRQSRIITEYTFIEGNEKETKAASYRVYTFRELTELLREVGFTDLKDHGSMEGAPFELGSRSLYLLGTKP